MSFANDAARKVTPTPTVEALERRQFLSAAIHAAVAKVDALAPHATVKAHLNTGTAAKLAPSSWAQPMRPAALTPGLTDAVYHGDYAYITVTPSQPLPNPDPNGPLADGDFGGDNAGLGRVVSWAASHTPNYTFINSADTFLYSGDSAAPTSRFLGADASGAASTDSAGLRDTIFDAEGWFQTPTANDAGTYTVKVGGSYEILGVYVGGNGTPGSGTFIAASGLERATPTSGTFTLGATPDATRPADVPIEVIYGNGLYTAATSAVAGSSPATAVQILDPNGVQVTSYSTTGTNTPAPLAPTLNAPGAGNGQVLLSWTPTVLARSWSVYRSDPAHPTPTLVKSGITTTTWLDKLLTNGTPYTYYVTATGASGTSANSNTQTATPVSAGSLKAEGTVEVDERANSVAAGSTSTSIVNNLGTAGGTFNAVGGPITVGPVTDANNTSYHALQFSGTNAASSSFSAPADITGNNPRSIELWVENPTLDKGEETMVFWGGGGSNGSNEGFSYGSTYGVRQLGGAGYDLTWGDTAPGVTGTGAPVANVWHYLVFTYDGTNNSVYVDGNLYLQQPVAAGGLQTVGGLHVNLATGGSLDIASVRVSGGALTTADITNNFAAGVPGQNASVAPTTAPMLNPPTVGITEIDLSWTYDPNANGYNVYRTDPAHTTPVAVATGVQGLSYADKTVTTGTTYTYYVTSLNDAGPGPASNTVTAGPLPVPPATPTAVSVTSRGFNPIEAIISFPAVPFADYYNVERAYESSRGSGTPGTFDRISDTLLTSGPTITVADSLRLYAGINYFYRVMAVNRAGTSAPSAPVELNLTNGVEDHYYNNHWWKTLQQNTSAFASPSTVPADVTSGNPDNFVPTTILAGGTGAAVSAPTTWLDPPGDAIGPDAANFEPQVNLSGNDANTAPFPGIAGANFSNVLTGKIRIDTAGQYSVLVGSDNDAYLYVDGTLVCDDPGVHGVNATPRTVNPIRLAPGTYEFVYFHSQGTGGWAFQMNWSATDLTSSNPLPGVSGLVPRANLTYLSDDPAAPTGLSATVGPINGDNATYPVTVRFTDNSTSEIQYLLQRSTTSNFVPGTYSTVATTGLVDNGAPSTDPDGTTTTAGASTATITDPSAPAGQTFYYRVVALNYDGSSSATLASAVSTSPAAPPPANAVEAHFYNNQWWSSTALSTTAPSVSGAGSYYPAALTADASTFLPDIEADGTDTSGGPIPGVQGADFSAVFTGQLSIGIAGTYTFTSQTDDDGYLYVDDVLVSSDPGIHGVRPAPNVTPISLTAGAHDLEFFQSQGTGRWGFHLHYSGPDTGGVEQIVPSTALTPVARPAQTPLDLSATPSDTNGRIVMLTWTNNNTSAIRYLVQRAIFPDFSFGVTTLDTGITGTTFTDTLPSDIADAGYYYRVAAQNYDGTSAFTAPVSIYGGGPMNVTSISITDNPAAATVTTGIQRSQVRGLVLTFDSPTTLSASQLSLNLLNSGGSGLNDNSAPTPVTGVFGAPVDPSGDGVTWVVPFLSGTANTSATGSLNDGIYTLNISGLSGSGITSVTFHRLFGDIDGNKTVNALDYARFKQAFGTSTGAATFNAALDFDNNGTINASDYAQFKKRFGKAFSYT